MRKEDTASHRWRVKNTIGDNKADGEKEIGSRQERDGGPANADENSGRMCTRTEDRPQHEIRRQDERNEKSRSNYIAAVPNRLDQRNGVVAPIAQEGMGHDEHKSVDGDEESPGEHAGLKRQGMRAATIQTLRCSEARRARSDSHERLHLPFVNQPSRILFWSKAAGSGVRCEW